MSTPVDQQMVTSAPGTQAFKQDFSKWETLHKDVALGLERLEAALSQRVVERAARERLRTGATDRVPDTVSVHGGPLLPRACAGAALTIVQLATPLPSWALALVALAVVGLAVLAYRHAAGLRPVSGGC